MQSSGRVTCFVPRAQRLVAMCLVVWGLQERASQSQRVLVRRGRFGMECEVEQEGRKGREKSQKKEVVVHLVWVEFEEMQEERA